MQTTVKQLIVLAILLLASVACNPGSSVLPTRMLPAEPVLISTPTLSPAAPNPANSALGPGVNAVFSGSQSIGDPYIPELGSSQYDVQRYSLQLALDPMTTTISGVTRIELISLEDGLDQIDLDFVGFDIIGVEVAGTPAQFSREEKKLQILLPGPLLAGTESEVTVTYQGEPIQENSPYVGYTDHLGLSRAGDGSMYVLAEPDGARYWYPNNDHPRDKAQFRFEVTVPAGLTAVANGRLIEMREAEEEISFSGGPGHTFVWEHNFPMATYLALIVVGSFERLESVSPAGVPLRHYVSSGYRDEFEAAVSDIGETIDWMSELLIPYPFEVFGYVATELPPTAMENQTMVLMSNELIGRRTAVHELVHMWFGDWVSVDSWSEMWRKEGLATYLTMLWETRADPQAIDAQMMDVMASVARNRPHYPIGNPPPEHLLGYNTYFKGAAFVHALRREMGDDSFFAGLRAYLRRYGGATASDAQFQQAMEDAAGYSLESYFTSWLN
jgi:aminopeptidase N